MNLPKAIYLTVTEHDGSNDGIPIVWETPLNDACSNKEMAEYRAALLRHRYGETRIGKLIFEDEQEDIIDISDAITDEEIERCSELNHHEKMEPDQ